ncbi:hypothetical protein F8B43_2591 [Methylorubrum populi]|uniref:Uncharacterized protein n=1 Tax=Methylorubrum populi TaxID=223967 RepID=A0A833N022_9HYPH|nr:hypothetical protein F8B43_2591 [Methylorubrum populi]
MPGRPIGRPCSSPSTVTRSAKASFDLDAQKSGTGFIFYVARHDHPVELRRPST